MRRATLVLALAVSLGSLPGAWASERTGLAGEQTRVSDSVLSIWEEGAAELCDDRAGAVRLSFAYHGVAEGPYPGTFTEEGYVVIGPRSPAISSWSGIEVATGPIVAFGATFTIHSGDVVIEGRKWGLPPGRVPGAALHCGTFVDATSIHAPGLSFTGWEVFAQTEGFDVRYRADIVSPNGTTTVDGLARTFLGSDRKIITFDCPLDPSGCTNESSAVSGGEFFR